MQTTIKKIIQSSIDIKNKTLTNRLILEQIEATVILITQAFREGKKVLFCGNGGSAADAQHLAAEFSGRFYIDRKALPAEALHCNTSYITAVGNDYSYDLIYSRLIEGIGMPGDILIALSTSGNSVNILNAINQANKNDMFTIGLTGGNGGKLKDLSTITIKVPSTDTPRIQETHIMIGHIICQLVEERLFGSSI